MKQRPELKKTAFAAYAVVAVLFVVFCVYMLCFEKTDVFSPRENSLFKEITDYTKTDISAPDARVKMLVIPTNEELMIAKDTEELTRGLCK